LDKVLGLGIVLTAKNMMGGAFNSATGEVGSFGESADLAKAKFVGLSTAVYAGGKALTSSILSTYDAYADVAKAQGEIASLGIDDSGIESITKSATKFSNQWAGTLAPDFIRASYDIKSGIETLSNAAVGEFTSLAALTATATKSTTGQMTSLFATGYGIYRDQFGSFGESTIAGWKNMSDEEKDIEFGKYFSAGIASSVQKFKTDGGQMDSAISALGATATNANVAFAEQLTILGTLQKTMSGSEAATKYKSFLNTAAGAGDKLGLSLTDANNQLLSTPEILEQLQDKYGDTLDAVEKQELKKAFGTDEALAMIDLLYGKTGDLKKNISGMNTSLSQGEKKATEMAKAAQKGREFERLGQQMGNLSAIIGESFAPAVLWVTDKVSSLVQWVGDLSNENRAILGGIALFIATLAGLATAFGAVGIIASGLITLAPVLGGAWAIMMGPIGLVAAAVAGLGYVIWDNWGMIKSAWEQLMIYTDIAMSAVGNAVSSTWDGIKSVFFNFTPLGVIIKNWDPIVGFFSGLWDGVGNVFSSGIDIIKTYFGWTPLGMILNNWNPIVGFFSKLWDGIVGVFSGTWENIKSIFFNFTPLGIIINNWNPIVGFFSGLWDGIVDMFSNTWEKIKSSFFGVVDYIKKPFESFFDWIASKFAWITDIVSSIGNGISNVVGGIGKNIGEGLKTASNWFKLDESTNQRQVEQTGAFGFGSPQDAIQNSSPSQDVLKTNQPLQAKSSPQRAGNTTNSVKIEVHNPSSDVDVERAVHKALNQNEQSRRNRSFEDEEI